MAGGGRLEGGRLKGGRLEGGRPAVRQDHHGIGTSTLSVVSIIKVCVMLVIMECLCFGKTGSIIVLDHEFVRSLKTDT